MKRHLTIIILALATLASCKGKSEITPDPGPAKVPIRIATTVTRATDLAFEAGDNIGLYVVNQPWKLQSDGNHVDNGKFTFNGAEWNPDRQVYWLDDNTKADFYCYYPYTSSVASVSAFPFKVNTDQSTEAGYKASDFMWGKTTGASPSSDAVMITVKHGMSLLVIRLKAGTGWNDSDILKSEVVVSGLKTAALVNLADGSVTADGDAAEIKPLSIGQGEYKAIVVPQKVTDCELVRIRIGKSDYSLKTTIGLTSGKEHTCTIVVNRTSEGINIGIGPWETDDIDYGGTVE